MSTPVTSSYLQFSEWDPSVCRVVPNFRYLKLKDRITNETVQWQVRQSLPTDRRSTLTHTYMKRTRAKW